MEETEKDLNKDNAGENKSVARKKRLPKWLRITLKTLLWTVVTVVFLIVAILSLTVWILTPERLTPIAEKMANEYLNANVKLGRVELTVWHTFPLASVDVSGVEIESHVLDSYKNIPAYADSLLSLGRARVEVDLSKLALMRIDVREILVDSPKANIVALDDSTANYLIFKPTPEDTTKSEITIMPDVVVRKLSITNNQGLRYTDLKQQLSATLRTDSVELRYNNDDHFYSLLFKGGVLAEMPEFHLNQVVPFYFKGDINWNTKDPYKCTLRNFRADVAHAPVVVDADFALGDTLTVKSLKMKLGPLKYADLIAQVPKEYTHGIERIKTDFSLSMAMSLDRPYSVVEGKEPSFHAELLIPDCYVQSGKYANYRLNKFNVDAHLAYNGDHPDRSVVKLDKLLLDGFGIRLSASGTASNLFKDPGVDGAVKGSVDFAKVLKLIPTELPIRLSGLMDINTTMKFALSDLDVKSFHKVKVNGGMDFTDVRYTVPKDSMLVFVHSAKVKFGTDSKFTGKDSVQHNLLMASVGVDSAFAAMPGVKLALSNASVGAGSVGSAENLMDTTKITPIGARLKIGDLRMVSAADSAMFTMKGLESSASIRRFNQADRLPQMDFDIKTDRMRYRDRTTSFGLRDGNIALSANMRPKRESKMMQRMRAKIDSLGRLHPELSRDSLISMYMASRRKGTKQLDEDEYMDLSVDNKMKQLLRRWDLKGSLKARRGMLFTPYFPLRNVVRGLDMNFTADTFNINSLKYTVGHSDLSMSGRVSNIRSTLLGSKRRQLTIEFDVLSDTLDVNQLMKAMYRGSAFAADTLSSAAFNFATVSEDDETKMQTMVEASSEDADTAVMHAVIIPKNIAIQFRVRNKFARYSDLDLTGLRGDLNINRGVLRLSDLSGSAEGGTINLDMIYATADKHDIGVGMFMNMRDIQVGRFLKLVPSIDTIMPMLKGVDGLINARIGATTKVDSLMNVITPTTNAAVEIDGKNLVLLDSETFRKISKMLMFKNKQRNMIDSLSVSVAAYDSKIDIYPFILNMDRYRLGVMGTNDFDMNYQFHVSILKSPIPFKFGINISGDADDMKIRLGKAKLKENEVARTTLVNDSTKQNLFKQMGEVFRRGAEAALKGEELDMYGRQDRAQMRRKNAAMNQDDALSRADSLQLMNEGVIERPDTATVEDAANEKASDKSKTRKIGKRKKKNDNNNQQPDLQRDAVKPENDENNGKE